MVNATVEWPSTSLMTFGGWPAARSIVAAPCRRSCSRTGGRPSRAAPKENTERDQAIVAAARLGQTHDALALEHGLTRQRISQIIAAASPRTPKETQRQLIATRLRSRWDELEKIVRDPPPMHSAIGKVVVDTHGNPVINASAVIQAIKTELQIEQ